MKRVLSLATIGLFLAGLAMVPMSARADQATAGANMATTTHTGSATSPKPTSADPTKNDDKVTVTPSGSGHAPGATPTKTPVKSAS